MSLAETESDQEKRWPDRLRELGQNIPSERKKFIERLRRWVLVKSGTDNAIKRIDSNENDDVEMYEDLIENARSGSRQIGTARQRAARRRHE